jgi:hypothetical protein
VNVVEFQRVDNQVDPIGERTRLLRLGDVLYLRVRLGNNGHGVGPSWLFALIPLLELTFRVAMGCVQVLSPITR